MRKSPQRRKTVNIDYIIMQELTVAFMSCQNISGKFTSQQVEKE